MRLKLWGQGRQTLGHGVNMTTDNKGCSDNTHHVCALGRFSGGASMRWMVNSRGPAAPVEPAAGGTKSG